MKRQKNNTTSPDQTSIPARATAGEVVEQQTPKALPIDLDRCTLHFLARLYDSILQTASMPPCMSNLSINPVFKQIVEAIKEVLGRPGCSGFPGQFAPPAHVIGLMHRDWLERLRDPTMDFVAKTQEFSLPDSRDGHEFYTQYQRVQEAMHKEVIAAIARHRAMKTEALKRMLPDMQEQDPHGKPEGEDPEIQTDNCKHSPDFRNVVWCGREFIFTGLQAAVVKVLWQAWELGTPDVGDAFLLESCASSGKRLRDVFKGNKAWGTMIREGHSRGSHRLHPDSTK